MVKAACLLAAALLLVSSGAAYSRSQVSPTTIVWAEGRIAAFAQDGDQIAWASMNDPVNCTIRIRLLGSKKQKIVAKPNDLLGCSVGYGMGDPRYQDLHLALAGRRALWTLWDGGNVITATLVTASYDSPRNVQLDELVNNADYDGDFLGGTSGDSSTLVYGFTSYGFTDEQCPEAGEGCEPVVSGGGVERVTGAHKIEVPSASPSRMLAASGHRIAVVVAGDTANSPGATVVVTNAVAGDTVSSFSPAGTPLGIAFAPSVVAVLESADGERQIEFYTPAGELIRTVAIPDKATALSITDERAVFRVGNSIRSVRVVAGSIQTIGTAAATPIGLSIEGTRVAWAENVKVHGVLHGRIVKVTVR